MAKRSSESLLAGKTSRSASSQRLLASSKSMPCFGLFPTFLVGSYSNSIRYVFYTVAVSMAQVRFVKRPKLNDPAHGTRESQTTTPCRAAAHVERTYRLGGVAMTEETAIGRSVVRQQFAPPVSQERLLMNSSAVIPMSRAICLKRMGEMSLPP